MSNNYRNQRQLITTLNRANELLIESRDKLSKIQELGLQTQYSEEIDEIMCLMTKLIGDDINSEENGILSLTEILQIEQGCV